MPSRSTVRFAVNLAKRGALVGAFGVTAALAAHYADIHRKKPYDLSWLEGDMVYVPGFKGTHLHDAKTGERVYMTVPLALNIEQPDLRLETDWDHPDAKPSLVPGDVITDFAGGLVNFSGNFAQMCRDRQADKSLPEFNYHEFPYDFRQDNLTSSRKLAAFVQKIYDTNGNKRVLVVGFSMGGLLSMHLLHTNPHLVRGLLLVGSPVSSLRGILKVLNNGDTLLFNSSAHADIVQSTWMSGYSMLCVHGRDMFIDAETGESVHLDLWDPETWITRRLTTAIRNAIAEGREHEAREFMKTTLSRAKEFNRDMRKYDPHISYPPIATIHGKTRTIGYTYRARFGPNGELMEVDWENPVTSVPADGTAPVYSTALPPGIPVMGTWESDSIHRSMMNDLPVVVEALQCVVEGKRKGK